MKQKLREAQRDYKEYLRQQSARVARVMRPYRPRLAASLAAALEQKECLHRLLSDGATEVFLSEYGDWFLLQEALSICRLSAQEVWEVLIGRGLLPLSWIDADERRFGAIKEEGSIELPEGGRAPLSLGAALAVAADPEGIVRAEKLALEARERLRPWHPEIPARVVWVMEPSPRAFGWGDPLYQQTRLAVAAMHRVVGDLPAFQWHRLQSEVKEALPQTGYQDGWRPFVRHILGGALFWRMAARLALQIPYDTEDRGIPFDLAGASFAALPDPFSPFLDIFASGYVLAALREEGLCLVAPEI